MQLEIDCVDGGDTHIDQYDRKWEFFDWPVSEGYLVVECHICKEKVEQGWVMFGTAPEFDGFPIICEPCIRPLWTEHTGNCFEIGHNDREEVNATE